MTRSTLAAIVLVTTALVVTGIVFYTLQIPFVWPNDPRDDIMACGGLEGPCP